MGASGSTTINFGSFPGGAEAQTDVTGQTGLTSSAQIEAWILPIATAAHSADEHMIENLRVVGFYKVDGTLTVRGYVVPFPRLQNASVAVSQPHLLHGQFTIGWAWA
jgi:hypothetical protein